MRRLVFIALLAFLCAGAVSAQPQQQVEVSVKVVEFQTTKGVETGLSAYFSRFPITGDWPEGRPYGRVSSGNGNVVSADVTFPSSDSTITVFLDRITNEYGHIDAVLQALVDQNRASILSRPKVMVMVGQEVPTVIQTTREVPYESTVVIGATATQVTEFRPTGVTLDVRALQVIDDDGNPNPTEDTYIQLVLKATVDEEGKRITVALDDMLATTARGGLFDQGNSNAISVPQFDSRSVTTTVWVRHGQVLILGGLYRNTKRKDLSTLPWLTQGEDMANSLVQRVMPFNVPSVPLSAGLGNRRTEEGRRELVFLVRAELWKPAYTVAGALGFEEGTEGETLKERMRPTDVISGVLEGITEMPKGLAEEITGEEMEGDAVREGLGGDTE